LRKANYIHTKATIIAIAFFSFLATTKGLCDSISEMDSLFNNLKTVQGPGKIQALIKLTSYLQYDAPDSANYFGMTALKLARNIGEKETEAGVLNTLADMKRNNGKNDSALYYSDLGIQICKENGLEEELANFYYKKGLIHEQKSSYDSALYFYKLTLQLSTIRNDTLPIVNSQVDIGYLYYFWGENDSALYYLNKGLLLSEESDYKTGVGRITVALGNMHFGWKNYDKAIVYYKKAYGIAKEINSKSGMGVTLSNIGAVYSDLKNYPEAIKYLKMSIPVLEEMNEDDALANSYLSLVICYTDSEVFDTARFYIEKSLKILEKHKNKESLAIAYDTYSQLYLKSGDYRKSIEYIQKALAIAEEINFKLMLQRGYKRLAVAYEKMAFYKPSIAYWMKYDSIKDSLVSEKTLKDIADFEAKYKSEKQRKEIALLEKDNEIKELDLKKKRWQQNTTFAGLVVVILFVIALYYRYRINRKTTKLLSEKNEQISKQNRSLAELNKKQEELIATKDKFFSIIAHDLKSPFNLIQGISDLFYEDFENLTEDEKKKFIQSISRSAKETFKLLENLLEWSYSQTGNLNVNTEDFDVTKTIKGTIAVLQPQANRKNISILSDETGNIRVFADMNMVRTILRNLVSNAIKFSYPGSEIKIQIAGVGDFIKISIQDKGVGIDKKNLDKLFRIDNKIQTRGTANEKGTGLGLVLCQEFVTKNGGVISVESEKGKGSIFVFSLPISKTPK
jgi:signal transduction histidine kinase